MPVFFTLLVAKIILYTSRSLGRGGGSALPGLVAERLDPQINAKLAKRLGTKIIITGTNGKTTTSKILATILTDQGQKVVQNRAGSNLSRGIASALIEYAGLFGGISGNVGLFEVDEAAMPAVAAMIQPDKIVVLNLFRDQLDRYGELDKTASLIGRGIGGTKAHVFLNADDPLVASLSQYSKGKVSYFGIERAPDRKLEHDHTADSFRCPFDNEILKYSTIYFGHIGHYACPKKDFVRPKVDLSAAVTKEHHSAVEFTVKTQDITLPLPGLYNTYNALAAIIASGYKPEQVIGSLQKIEAAFGRVEQLEIEGRKIFLLLIKNPTGFNQIIQTFLTGKEAANILIAINDNFADGRDVSWLWDVGIEDLSGPKEHYLITSGARASDMALRLKYADIAAEINEDLEAALDQLLAATPAGETAYLLPTYTAMLEIRRIMSRRIKLAGIWQ